jgi:protein-S-isoprenylcysteine O-methyltransferase Ste14
MGAGRTRAKNLDDRQGKSRPYYYDINTIYWGRDDAAQCPAKIENRIAMTPKPVVNLRKLVRQSLVHLALLAAALFLGAGTLAWPAAWAYLAYLAAYGFVLTRWLLRHDPALLNERMTGFSKPGLKTWDKLFLVAAIVLYLGWIAANGLDAVRFQWSHVPTWLRIAGGAALLWSGWLIFAVFRENSFLAPAVRIQSERGQTVISTGPYAVVRHPLYASLLVWIVGSSLVLGAAWALVVGLLLMIAVAIRAVGEEHVLRAGLPGYDAYMDRVRWRFVPYVW